MSALTWRFGSTVALLSASLAVSILSDHREQQPLARPLASIDRSINGWTGTDDPPLADRIEASLAASSYVSRTYSRGPANMNLFVAYYLRQRAGEGMHSPKYCMPGAGWEMVDSGNIEIPGAAAPIRINNYTLYKESERLRVLYWYQGRLRVTADEYLAKAYLVWDALRYGETSGSIVRLTLDERPDALPEGVKFAGEAIRQVQQCYGRLR